MKFSYSSIISAAPDGQDYVLIRRPEIPITILGPARAATYVGLVDTGSDNTIFPKSVADYLGLAIQPAFGSTAIVFGGHHVQLHSGEAILKLEVESDILTWNSPVFFYDLPTGDEESIILGHSGFLDYFTANFDGENGILTLTPNADLPTVD